MINLALTIRNPFSQQFTNLWRRACNTPLKNKCIELEVYKDSTIITSSIVWTICQSHAGLDLELGLFGYCVHFNFYDRRHWNYEEKRYYIYEE
jgi:hypothetical protein